VESASLVQDIAQAALCVHLALGPGFLEGVYGRAMIAELRQRGLVVDRERMIKIWYGSQLVGKHRLDLVVGGAVIVELKANRGLATVHLAQLRSYLHATSYSAGMITNFGRAELEWDVLER
jgi:GxxExxY protein